LEKEDPLRWQAWQATLRICWDCIAGSISEEKADRILAELDEGRFNLFVRYLRSCPPDEGPAQG
jgi:hypothetical protein